jgi:hypothetical protein
VAIAADAAYERALWTCERCGSREDLNVHHRLYRSRGGRLVEHEAWTLSVLCHSRSGIGYGCHGDVHETSEYPWVVPGEVVRDKITKLPVYRGPDAEYQAAFAA